MKILYIVSILSFNFLFSQYMDIEYASFSYTIGGSYGSCVKFKKSEYSFSDYNACSCAWAANVSNYSDCHDLLYNPQTKMIKYNLYEGGEYTYRSFSNDYTCHLYVEEIENPILDCSEMNQEQCSTDSTCEWVEDFDMEWCSFDDAGICNSVPGCNWDCDSWYTWLCGCEGQYQVDDSYCEEVEIYECSEFLTESSCVHTAHLDIDCSWIIDSQVDCTIFNDESGCNSNNCDWNEDIETINCSNLPTYGWGPGNCDYYYPDCYEYLDYGGSYGSWSTACGGGIVQIDNSFCDGDAGYCLENQYLTGDVNQDTIINIQDIILVVNLILNNEYDQNADMNFDNILNVIDAIQIINIILNN